MNWDSRGLEDASAVLHFLEGARRDGNVMYNARTAEEAFGAFCRLMDWDEASVKLHLMGMLPRATDRR